MLLIFLLPSYQVRFSIFGLPSTLLEGMILICFAVWMIRDWSSFQKRINQAWQKKRESHRYPFDLEIVGLVLLSWFGIIAAGFSASALGLWRAYFFEPILVFLMIYNVLGDANLRINANQRIANVIDRIMWPLVLSALTVSVVATLQKLGVVPSPENFWPRVTGVWDYPNALGLYVGPLIPLMTGWVFFKISNFQFPISKQFSISNFPIFQTIIILLSIGLSIISLFFASSEGAMIGVLVAFSVMFFVWLSGYFKKEGRIKLFGCPAFAVGGFAKRMTYYFNYFIIFVILLFTFFSSFIFLYAVPENKYFDFESSTLNYVTDKTMLKDFSGEVRKQQWRETLAMLSEDGRWLWGAGLASYQRRVEPYHQEGIFFNKERDPKFYNELVWGDEEYKWKHWQPVEIYMYPHNVLLNFWTELGVIGTALMLWIIGKFIYVSVKWKVKSEKRFLALGLLGSMIVIVVHGLVDVPYFKNDLSVMFWILVALLGVLTIKDSENNKTLSF